MTMSTPLPPLSELSIDRERAIALLTRHFANDVLTEADFEARLEIAYSATSARELEAITADLPSQVPSGQITAFFSGQERKLVGAVPRDLDPLPPGLRGARPHRRDVQDRCHHDRRQRVHGIRADPAALRRARGQRGARALRILLPQGRIGGFWLRRAHRRPSDLRVRGSDHRRGLLGRGLIRYTSIFENRHAPAVTNSTPTASSTATSTPTPKCVVPIIRPRTPSIPYVSGSTRVSTASAAGRPCSG